jgi:hypothetical protein
MAGMAGSRGKFSEDPTNNSEPLVWVLFLVCWPPHKVAHQVLCGT